MSNRDGKTKQLYVIPAAGGEARRLTDLPEDVTETVWSADGTRLAFTSRVRDPEYDEEDDRRRRPRRFTRLQFKLDSEGWIGDRRRHVFTVPADGSAPPTQLTHGDYEDQSPQWSPDGRRLVFASARQEDWDVEMFRDLYVVGAEGGEPAALTKGYAWYEAPSWSPDGSAIACRFGKGDFDFPRHGQIAVLDPATGEARLLTTALDRNCAPYPEVREPVWDGDSLLFVLEDSGNRTLYRVGVAGSAAPEPVVDGELSIVGFDCVEGQIVHAASLPTVPAELYAGEARLTEVSAPFTSGRELSEPERFTAVSADGSEVEAWLMRPLGFDPSRRYPVLLNIHGGPFSQYGNTFFDEFQVYAEAGYVVVYSNPRARRGTARSGAGRSAGRLRTAPAGGPSTTRT